jgi:hypothetical protein
MVESGKEGENGWRRASFILRSLDDLWLMEKNGKMEQVKALSSWADLWFPV